MLRVGLTGGLGSGKSTAAAIFASLGAHVFYADEIGRDLMQPGHEVYSQVVAQFGRGVLREDGSLDRAELARLAFGPESEGGGRIEELNAIVHPATIARQTELIDEVAAHDPDAVVIVESALIFETKHGGEGGWQRRFDRLIFVHAPENLKVARYISRSLNKSSASDQAIAQTSVEARRRLGRQIDDGSKASQCDYVLKNDGTVESLRDQVDILWPILKELAKCG